MEIFGGKITKAIKTVVYGPEGIGKSTFASLFPDAVFSDVEGSTDHMDVRRYAKPTSWQMLNQQADYIRKFRPFKTWIIDTADWAERLCIEHVISNANKSSIVSFGYGEGFIQLEEEFGRFLNKLNDVIDAGVNVVITAHAKIVRFEQPDEAGAYDRWELKLGNKTTAKTASLLKEWADMVLFVNYKTLVVTTDEKLKKHKAYGGQRVMYTSHHPAWDAKNRFSLADELPFDFGAIAHIFNETKAPSLNNHISGVNDYSIPPIQQNNGLTYEQRSLMPQPQQQVQPAQQQQSFMAGLEVKYPEAEIDYSNLPQALVDLMKPQKVTKEEIQKVVASKGYFPITMPVQNYPTDFIQGVLVAAWPQVSSMIMDSRQPALNITANDLPY